MSKGGIRKRIFIFLPHDSLYRFIYIPCINLKILSNFRLKIFNFRHKPYFLAREGRKIFNIFFPERATKICFAYYATGLTRYE